MELKYFRLIKTIAEAGNIAKSSERLFLTQSALSHQLKDLENQLGFKVFLRKRHQWQLTEEGEELYQLANEVLVTIERGFSKIQSLKEGSKGSIRVGTACYSFYQDLPNFIQKMAVLYPEITVQLGLEATHQPISKLLSNEIDIAIVTQKPSSELLESIPLFEDEIFAIMHTEHPLSQKEYLEAPDFSDIHLIIHSFPLETVSVYEQFLKRHHIHPIQLSAMPLTEVSLEMVNSNMGVFCVPKWALASFKLSADLVFQRISKNGLKRTHYLVVRKTDRQKKYIHDFIVNIEEEFVGK